MAETEILKQALAIDKSFMRASYHPKARVRKKNYNRMRRIINWQYKIYGHLLVPREWLKT